MDLSLVGVHNRRMDKKPQPLGRNKYVRVNDRAELALDRVVAEMSGRPGLAALWGKRLSQEAVACASWLWMEDMGWDALEQALAPYVAKLRAIVDGEAEPAAQASPREVVAAGSAGVGRHVDPETGKPLEPKGGDPKRKGRSG